MSANKILTALFLSLILLICCNNEDENPSTNAFLNQPLDEPLDFLRIREYYDENIFLQDLQKIYGVWELASTTQEGFNGPIMRGNDFDTLIIQPNAIFGILKNQKVISYGKIERIVEQNITFLNFINQQENIEDNLRFLQHSKVSIVIDKEEDDELEIFFPSYPTTLHIMYAIETLKLGKF